MNIEDDIVNQQSVLIERIKTFAQHPLEFIEYFLERKPTEKQRSFIQNLEMAENVEYDISQDIVGERRKRHFIAIWSRQTGKSTIISSYVLWRLLFGKGSRINGEQRAECIMVLAPILDQVRNLYDKISFLIDNNPIIQSFILSKNMDRIICKNGNMIIFRSASSGSHIRGFTATCIIIDETQDITDMKYYGDIMPFGATTNALIIETGTPKDKNHFWQNVEKAKDPKSNIMVTTQKWFECPFLSKEYVMGQKESSPDALWRQEYMCEFAETGIMAFPSNLFAPNKDGQWNLAEYDFIISKDEITKEKEEFIKSTCKKGNYAAGLDLGRSKDFTEFSIWKLDEWPARLAVFIEFPLGTPYTEIAREVKFWFELYNLSEFNFDYTNEKGFADILIELGVPVIIDKSQSRGATIFTTKVKMDMVTKAVVLLENYRLQLPRLENAITDLEKKKQRLAERLLQQFLNQQFETSEDTERVKKYYHPSNQHDDMLWSSLLALKNINVGAALNSDFEEFHNPWETPAIQKKSVDSEVLVSHSTLGRAQYESAAFRRDEAFQSNTNERLTMKGMEWVVT